MALTEQQIRQITDEIVRSLTKSMKEEVPAAPPQTDGCTGRWLCDTAEEAVANAKAAQAQLSEMTLEKRGELIAAMRKAGIDNAEYLARLAHEETGYGRVADKVQKNLLVSRRTPGIEDLVTRCETGDKGMMLIEQAPFGVIGSITPSTNPTSTVINNSISMIAAGNAVVFNPHPAAKRASQEAMRLMVEAIISVGGAAGPGNPPVIVDDTADIPEAAKRIVDGAAFDNNVLCIAEKEVFAFSNITDRLMSEMERVGAFRISGEDIDKVMRTTLINKDGHYLINRKYVGRDAAVILRDAGVRFTGDPRLVIAEVDRNHPFVTTEMLMPVLAIVRVHDIDEAIEEAFRAERGCKHSAMIHSSNVHNMSKAARKLNTTIFVKNSSSFSGLGFDGEGYTTMTIATPTGEGVTSARSFTRLRRCVLYGDFRIC